MERSKLLKCKSLIALVWDSIDIPAYSNILPAGTTKLKGDLVIKKACTELELNTLCNLLSAERSQYWTKQFYALNELRELDIWTALIALSNQAEPDEIIGGIIYVDIPGINTIYIAALYVKLKFRSKRVGQQLLETVLTSVQHQTTTIIFYDCPRFQKYHVYPTIFPRKGKTIYKIIGYIQNILNACDKNMTAQRTSKETRISTISKICFIPNEVDINKVINFDEMVSGCSRDERLKKLVDLDGIMGLASINQAGEISGYGLVTIKGMRRRPVIGPVYARTSFAAFQILDGLCSLIDHFTESIMYIASDNKLMLDFFLEDTEAEVCDMFTEHYTDNLPQLTRKVQTSMIYIHSSHFLLPEC